MKSYFLDHVTDISAAERALCEELPGQTDPWIIFGALGNPVAYLRIGIELEDGPNLHIQADISGRHYHKDAIVIELLERLQKQLGGTVSSDA